MTQLNLDRNLDNPDSVYELLMSLNNDDNIEKSLLRVNKLALLLANHIGDATIIAEAVAIAKSASK